MSVSLTCKVDVRGLTIKQLGELYTEVIKELKKRQEDPNDLSCKGDNKRKKEVTREYIDRWESWVIEAEKLGSRDIKFKWTKKKKVWFLEFFIVDEFDNQHAYSRHGKNKKTTHCKLAEAAWYRYQNSLIES